MLMFWFTNDDITPAYIRVLGNHTNLFCMTVSIKIFSSYTVCPNKLLVFLQVAA